jgi:hypothetical protein
MPAAYDYLFLNLGRVPTPHQALAERLRTLSDCTVVGQFAPQIGWSNNEAAVLIRWPDQSAREVPDLGAAPLVERVRIEALAPTVRPADADRPAHGGIYVHRWFEVEAPAVDEFVDLSGQGWRRFEALFDAKIFGLFRAETSAEDRERRIARLLLLTRYGDHGVWEASRDPTTEAMQIFARRRELTRRTWAASTRLLVS